MHARGRLETHNLQAIPEYFHADKIGKWKEAAVVPLLALPVIIEGALVAGTALVGIGIAAGGGV